MKKIVLLLVVLIFIGCDLWYSNLAYDHTLYYGDFSNIESIEDIDDWLVSRIDLQNDDYETWSNLKETLARGYGDCDDFAIGYLNILSIRFGIEGSILLVESSQLRTIVSGGGRVNHAIVMYEGIAVDPVDGEIYGSYEDLKSKIGYIYSFEEIFY